MDAPYYNGPPGSRRYDDDVVGRGGRRTKYVCCQCDWIDKGDGGDHHRTTGHQIKTKVGGVIQVFSCCAEFAHMALRRDA